MRDFNLMVRRKTHSGTLEVRELAVDQRLDAASTTVLSYLLEGEVLVSDRSLARGETLLLNPGETCMLRRLERPASLALCRLKQRPLRLPHAP